MKRRLAFFIAAVLLVASSAFASPSPANTAVPVSEPALAPVSQEVREFTLESAMDYALKNHSALLAAQANITKNKVALDEAKSAYNNMWSKNAYSFDMGATSFIVKKGLGVKSAEMALLLSQKGLEQAEASVKFGVESAFYTYSGMSDKVKSANENLTLAQKKLEDMQKKKDVGLVSDFDMLSVKTMVKQAQFNFDKATMDMETAEFEFKSAIGLDSGAKVKLSGTLELAKQPEIKLEDAITKAKENRMEVVSARQKYLLSEESARITALWYEEKTYKYQESQYIADSDNFSYIDSLNKVELSVRKAYSSMKNAYEGLEVLDANIALYTRVYELEQKKYDVGLATSLEVTEAFQKVADMKIGRADAVLGYVLATRQFEYSYSIGVAAR